jgi:ABC-type antimicrobial peptide transport system permease subunit
MAMVMLDAARLLLAGLAIGTIIALLAGRSAASLLFGIVSYDPVTLLSAIALLALSAAAASFLPARGAARLDPLTALRHE